MTIRTMISASLFVGMSAIATAQVSPPPQTAAAQCQLDAASYQTRKFSEMRAAGQPLTVENTTPVRAEARRMARECGAKISLDSASAAELTALASLDLFAGDTARAKDAVARAVTKPGMSEGERANADLAAEQLAIATFDPFAGINPDAERSVRDLDGLSDAVIAQKIDGHQRLLGRYEYADIDDGLRDHARKLLDVANRALRTNALGLTPARVGSPSVNMAYSAIASAYSSLARGEGDFLRPDSAIKIIDEAFRVIGADFPLIHRYLDAQRAMYALVGTKATPIDGKWWINTADGSTFQPGKAQVTVIQFTAHWCVPCKNSYPGFMRMTARFADKPVESIMVTELYGFVGTKRGLSADEEVAADREYYAKEHGLPFKIAINPPLPQMDTTTQNNDRRYAVNGIPEIIVVDEAGIIRAMVVGWDKGNEQRLSALIYRILAEKKKK